MSGMKYLHALDGERRHAQTLLAVIFAVVALAMVSTWFAWRTPKDISVYLPPDLSRGTTVQVKGGETAIPAQVIYTFAYYVWQQINRWPADGSVDYGNQIFAMQNYITPQCRAQLEADIQARARDGELRLRTRSISEIAGLSYASNRVLDEGSHGAAWTVFLDTQVQETFKGQPVKDIFIRFPIRVVRYDVDRQRNPWQLAVDCYGNDRPERLSESDLHVSDPATGRSLVRAPDLPGAVAPAALPAAAPLESDQAASATPADPAMTAASAASAVTGASAPVTPNAAPQGDSR